MHKKDSLMLVYYVWKNHPTPLVRDKIVVLSSALDLWFRGKMRTAQWSAARKHAAVCISTLHTLRSQVDHQNFWAHTNTTSIPIQQNNHNNSCAANPSKIWLQQRTNVDLRADPRETLFDQNKLYFGKKVKQLLLIYAPEAQIATADKQVQVQKACKLLWTPFFHATNEKVCGRSTNFATASPSSKCTVAPPAVFESC